MRLWISILPILVLGSCTLAGEYLMNDTGEAVTGLKVCFSEPVVVTSFGDCLTIVAPEGEATEFTFSGGEVAVWGGHWLGWQPASVAMISYEWLRNTSGGELQSTWSSGTDRFYVEAEHGWWSDVLFLCNGKGDRATLEHFHPDAINYSFLRPRLADVRYVAASKKCYQENYSFNSPTSGLYRIFEPDMARTIHGETITQSGWGGAYYMDPHADAWAERVLEDGILAAFTTLADGVSVDNIGVPPFIKGGGGFSAHEKEGFRENLAAEHTEGQLATLGIADVRTFDIAQYILEKDYLDGNPAALEDPIFRDFVKYQYVSNLEIWANMVEQALERAGRDMILHGNQYGISKLYSSNPYSVLLSQQHQVVEIEVANYLDLMPPKSHYSLSYKIGLASGLAKKPVWILGIVYDWGTDTRYLEPDFLRLITAETYANGAIRTFEPVQGGPEGSCSLPDETLTSLLDYYDWIREHRTLFEGRSSAAKTAIVYSIPTMLWQYFPTTGHWNWDKTASLSGFALALECEHIPYDIVVFGHPDLWDDAGLDDRLAGYDLLILPDVDCLTGYQIRALEQFVEAGGAILYSGNLGTRNEDYVPRSSTSLASLQHSPSVEEAAGTPARAFYGRRIQGLGSAESALRQLAAAIDAVPQYERQLVTDAPDTVGMNLYRDPQGGLMVHLVNYNYDRTHHELRTTTPFAIRLSLPEDFSFEGKDVFFISDDARSDLLEYSSMGQWIEFIVPGIQCHAIIGVTDMSSLEESATTDADAP